MHRLIVREFKWFYICYIIDIMGNVIKIPSVYRFLIKLMLKGISSNDINGADFGPHNGNCVPDVA